MRGLVQRVKSASVRVVGGMVVGGMVVGETVAGEVVGEIGAGLCVLVGVTHDDAVANAHKLAEKIWHLRILDDTEGVMNRSLAEKSGWSRGVPHASGDEPTVSRMLFGIQ